ncbi:MAG: transcriptional regulator NrdR [Holophagaceae bacterium]|nr:transcriptional regulator NrdR [Holophagaceae bacterium]
MRCPFCGHPEDKVVDSREAREGDTIRRRRECLACSKRFTSYERVEEIPILIVKKDGRREPFDRNKLLRGMLAACQKRPVCLTRLEELAGDIHSQIAEQPDREIRSLALGEMVMDGLKTIDSVAYVRFASVYREFKDLSDFVKSLETLVGTVKKTGPRAFATPDQVSQPILGSSSTALNTPLSVQPQTPLFPGEINNPASKKRKT